MKRFNSLVLAAVMGASLAACSAGHGTSALPAAQTQSHAQTPQQHRVRHLIAERRPKDVLGGLGITVTLFDAPLVGASGGSAQFNAGIMGVDIIDSTGSSWQLISFAQPQVVDLLTLQTTPMNLGSGNLPAGNYVKAELLLDPKTTSVIQNGINFPIQWTNPNYPFWNTTGAVEAVDVPVSLAQNASGQVTASIDFNVFNSTDLNNGMAYLNPQLAAGIGAQPGVNGSVVNAAGAPVSNATIIATNAAGAVANVSVTGADGSFHLHGIDPGTYTLSVANTYTTAAGVTVTASGNDAGAAPSTTVTVSPSAPVTIPSLTD